MLMVAATLALLALLSARTVPRPAQGAAVAALDEPAAGAARAAAHPQNWRRAMTNLQYREQLLTETGQLAKVGGWEFDPASGEGGWTAEVRAHPRSGCLGGTEHGNWALQFYPGESRAEAGSRAAEIDGQWHALRSGAGVRVGAGRARSGCARFRAGRWCGMAA